MLLDQPSAALAVRLMSLAEQLNPSQQAEMTKLYNQIEANHARRIEAAAELAKLWQVSLDSVIDQLGLSPSGDDE